MIKCTQLTVDHCSSTELKDDTVIVVLGASGDLAKKKTFPALFGLVGFAAPQSRGGEALMPRPVPQQIPP